MGDPIIEQGVTLAVGGVGGLLGLAYMARGFIRRVGRDLTEMTKDRVEGDLYVQLSEQVKDNRRLIEEYQAQRETYIERIRLLELEVGKCQQHVTTIEDLQRRLDARETEMRSMMSQWQQERDRFLQLLSHQQGLPTGTPITQ